MLSDSDFLVVHDVDLAEGTTGSGLARQTSRDEARLLRLRDETGSSPHPVPLLSDVVELIRRFDAETIFELDLKDDAPWPRERAEELVAVVGPVRRRITVGGPAATNLRALRLLDPDLSLGLSPQYEVDWTRGRRDEPLPRRRGAYGYFDDHPLAERRTLPTAEYLRRRIADILALVPGLDEVHLRLEAFERMHDDGFADIAEVLHRADVSLDVWTLDAGTHTWRERLARAVERGADLVTTNTPRQLAVALTGIPGPSSDAS
jgi:glycerophosphoryl diester phosphodiesterase